MASAPTNSDLLNGINIDALRHQEPKALNAFVRLTCQAVKRQAIVAFRAPEADAEDLASETITRCISRLDLFDSSRGSLAAWVHTVAKNVILGWLRRQRRRDQIVEVTAAKATQAVVPQSTPMLIPRGEALTKLRCELSVMPEADVQLLALGSTKYLAWTDIAAITGLTIGNAKVRYARLCKRLHKTLSQPTATHAA